MIAERSLYGVKMALLAMQRYSWEQGVAAQAFLELGDLDTVILLAKDAVNRQTKEGQLALMHFGEAYEDPAANGEAVLLAARLTGEARLKQAAERMLDYMLHIAPKTADGIHLHFGRQVWIDSMYMTPPFLAAAGHFKEALKQVEGFRSRLWDASKHLYSHMWDEEKQEFARKDFWGVGNGWTAAGLARLIRLCPAELPQERERLIGYARDLVDACLVYLRPDGLFHNVLDNPATFVETNLAQMIAYTIYRGLQGGWLRASYLPYAERMRSSAHSKVDGFGLVQGVCGSPDFDHPGTAPEGQAFFLLMEAAHRDLGVQAR